MIHTFQWNGILGARIQRNLPPGITATIDSVVPSVIITINLSDDAGLQDLIDFMDSHGWVFVS